MPHQFVSLPSYGADFPISIEAQVDAQPLSDVSDKQRPCMSDGERALRIGLHFSMSEHLKEEWGRSSNFADIGRAIWHEERQRALEEAR